MAGYDGAREMLHFFSELRLLVARLRLIFAGQLGFALLWPGNPQAVQDCTDLSKGFEIPSLGVTQIFSPDFDGRKDF